MIARRLTGSCLTNTLRHYIRYSRQYFENLNIDYDAIEKKEQEEKVRLHKQAIHEVKSNDKNANNFIKNLKVDHQLFNHFAEFKQKQTVQECAIIVPEPRKEPVMFSARRNYIVTSIKKAREAMRPIRKQYLYDAINFLENSEKKVGKIMLKTLYSMVRHAIERGFDPFRVFIHGFVIGKTMRFKGIRYHAKGKSGRENKDLCQIKIIAIEKDEKEFFEQVGAGEAPAGFASIVRHRLVSIDADYKKISSMTGITTSKGRQQKKELIRRRVFNQMEENKQNNVYVPKRTIIKEIRTAEGVKALELFKNMKREGHVPSLKRRELLFKKNMGTL